jgi:hypothetical protein
MRKRVSIASAAFCLVLGAGPLHAASVEAYGRLPSIDNVSLSPDGAQIAFVQTVGLLITTSYSGAPPMVVTQLIGEVRELTLLNTATHKYIVLPNCKQASYTTRSVEIGRYQVRRICSTRCAGPTRTFSSWS